MRRTIAALLLVLTLLGTGLPVHAQEPWRPGVQRAIAYSERRSGDVSFAVVGPAGRMYGYRRAVQVPTASVIKAMFLAGYLRHPSVRDRRLRDSDRALLGPMIKRSDNDSATRVADFLGPRRINRLAAVAGMQDFRYTRPWGLSLTSARDQAGFFFELERYIPRRHEDYARYLLSHIIRSQRWGIGQLSRPNWRFFFKGGWGSGTGWVCHQVAFLEREGKRIAVAIMIRNSPSHDYATESLRGIADRLLDDLPTGG
ncbi:MAG: serine hydrolase [Actinomycetota bacterium]